MAALAAAVFTLSSVSNAVPSLEPLAAASPTFVQQVGAHGSGASLAVTPGSAITTGDRLVVEVGIWNASAATAAAVTDAAGNTYTEVLHFTASDQTEMSIWSAPVTAGGGTRPAITARATSSADIGMVALEYANLSSAPGGSSVDQQAHSTGRTASAATVSSGPTPPTTAAGELAVGFYVDSGFGDTLTGGAGFTVRSNVSPAGDMELLVEDQVLGAGATPAAAAGTGANTVWLMATVVFQSAQLTAPAAPAGVVATPGNASASVAWTAPASGGSPITSYAVTPYVGSQAQPATVVTGSPPATNATVSGLTNGTSYTFTVSASNAIGTGPASAPSNAVTPSPQPRGQWGSLLSFPLVAISSTLMRNGNLIFWDGWQQPQPTAVWSPTNPGTFTTINAPDSIFCDGGAQLPDGRLLVIGGYGGLTTGQIGIVDTNVFDPGTNAWTRVANMHLPRWYPALTELSDGRYLALSGNSTDATHWADTPEVYDPAANTWTLLSGVSTSQIHEDEYPFSYLLPNGNVMAIGPSEDVTYELNVNAQTWTPVGGPSGTNNGSSVMYRPGKILYSGGAADIVGAASRTTTAVLDTTAAAPAWQQTAPMAYARTYHTLTMLADGRVLAVGGESTSDQAVVTSGVTATEIWDPSSQVWTAGAPMAAARNYHSTAVLQPDGTVLVAGGGHPQGLMDPGQLSAQIYSPSYLFNGPRPTIASAPVTATYGSSIAIATPDAASITAVNLVSLGADTHQSDMDQHFVPLTFTAGSGTLSVQAPAGSSMAPPGYYMLFVLNGQGTPSVASMIRIGQFSTTSPGAPTGVVATAGNASATVNWTAPSDGGSPITSYTVTPFVGTTAQTATVVAGSPPPTNATVVGLTNETSYTFTVKATNAVGTGPPSAASNPVTPGAPTVPAYVQSASARSPGTASLTTGFGTAITAGNRIVVEVGVWSTSRATASSVSDTAGNSYSELTHFVGSDGTEMSVWTAPITSGGGTKPTVTAKAASSADIGVAALEYSGLSTLSGTSVMDQTAHASGTTSGAATVQSGATAATGAANELAMGFYADSGFHDSLKAGSGFTSRVNVSPFAHMEFLVEDQLVPAGATPNAGVATGSNTVWLMETVVLKTGTAAPPTVPAAPTGVTAVAGNGSATVNWASPGDGGSPITSYTVTPFIGTAAQTPTVVSGNPPATSALVTGLTNGTAYTFIVSAANAVGSGPASAPSPPVTPSAPTVPGPPTGVSASPGSGSATVSWAAPADGGSSITMYTVTPFIGTQAQTATVVSGSPPPTTAIVTGLSNGTSYTFNVEATNGVGTGPPSAMSSPVTPTAVTPPAFVQGAAARGDSKTLLAVTTTGNVTSGNRVIVEVGVWGPLHPTTSAVTDTAGNAYVEVLHLVASDATELSVWTAPVANGGGGKLTIQASTTASADMGIQALEYSGLSTAPDASVIDQTAAASGTTAGAQMVSSGSTGPTAAGNELAVGFYADSGFGDALAGGAGYSVRGNVSPTLDMEFLAEDTVVGQGATPAASAGTGASTVWLMATVVLRSQTPLTGSAASAGPSFAAVSVGSRSPHKVAHSFVGPGGVHYYCRMG